MKIKEVFFSSGEGGFFFDDQAAIKRGLVHDGFLYSGSPTTAGFHNIRVPSTSVSIILVLEDGQVAIGDCCAVQYSGTDGRDPLFIPNKFIPWMEQFLKPWILGCDCSSFKENAKIFDDLKKEDGKTIHTAIRYGVTQALLDATAKATRTTIAETVSREYLLPLQPKYIKIYAQSGDERYKNSDKMILKGVDVMPHGLINEPHEKVGIRGEKLKAFVGWLRNRIMELRLDESYHPELHFDVYGTLGIVFENDYTRILDYLAELEKIAAPFLLRIEAPVDAGSREGQVEALKEICEGIIKKGITVEIVADEWCNSLEDIRYFADEHACHMIQIKTPDLGGIHNTIEAILYCKEKGIKAFQGGSCSETDIAARISTQIAVAVQPYQILAKPGMGVDEGFMTVKNEMLRAITYLRR
jgi:methylaspartate ammonia-lyase